MFYLSYQSAEEMQQSQEELQNLIANFFKSTYNKFRNLF